LRSDHGQTWLCDFWYSWDPSPWIAPQTILHINQESSSSSLARLAGQYCNDRFGHEVHPWGFKCHTVANGLFGRRTRCVDHGPGTNFTVCGACARRTLTLPWARATARGLQELSPPADWLWNGRLNGDFPPDPPIPNLPPWPGYLTRLCQTCEKQEQELCHIRQSGSVLPREHLSHEKRAILGTRYPTRNCTCAVLLTRMDNGPPQSAQNERHCRWHRYLVKQRIEDRKLANDHSLATLDMKVEKGKFLACTASASKREQRLHNGTYRACRCGADVEFLRPDRDPEVLMCMSCEGTVQLLNPAVEVSRYNLRNDKARLGKYEPRLIELQRPRSRFTPRRAMSIDD